MGKKIIPPRKDGLVKIFTKEETEEISKSLGGENSLVQLGGLIVERSKCCGASIYHTTGIIRPYCSKCHKPIIEPIYSI
jgi:hypothetical protein